MASPAGWPLAPGVCGESGSAARLHHTLRAIRREGMSTDYRWSGILPPLFWLTVDARAADERASICEEFPQLRETVALLQRWAERQSLATPRQG
eukprot:11953112-Prorocentrum_lima.AAC.1